MIKLMYLRLGFEWMKQKFYENSVYDEFYEKVVPCMINFVKRLLSVR